MKAYDLVSRTALLFLLLFPGLLRAQGVSFFSTDPAVFGEELAAHVEKSKSPAGQQAASDLRSLWAGGQLSEAEKETFITQVNLMVSKRFRTEPDLAHYIRIAASLKTGSAYVQIPLSRFSEVMMRCITELEAERTSRFLAVFSSYVASGKPIERSRFSWQASQRNPELLFTEIADSEGKYLSPLIRFNQTDFVYTSLLDSTRIQQASGDWLPLSMTLLTRGGRISWAKMQLDPNDVYCELRRSKINLNYGLVEADSVTFYYKSLINRPLLGRFEDRNVGRKSIGSANYPYFKSYEGGVVIENFIPNVRYEGGFSLRGIRKVGTAYDILTDPPRPARDPFSSSALKQDEKKSSEWGESQWENAANQEASFGSDDTYTPEEGWSSGSNPADESASALPSFLQHVKAQIEITRLNRTVMKIRGEEFVLDSERMLGDHMEASVYTSEGDSIYHPAMDVVYTAKDSTVILKKPKRSNFRGIPFQSSYHDYFLYFETIVWDLRSNVLEFTAFIDRENKISAIESFDYFNQSRFNEFKGLLPFNPIGAIYRYAVTNDDEPIFPEKILREYKMPEQEDAFRRTLPNLEANGFITYDKKTFEIKPTEKLFNYAMAARNKKDFDAIRISSQVDTGSHATLNLETMGIAMRGVRGFSLSDSVYLRALPLEGKVSVEKNRNLVFGGLVAVGKVNFYSFNRERPAFRFDYESYSIRCDSVDSLRFELVRNPPPGYEPTPLERALSKTVFEGVTGVIHVDDPNNKSAEKNYPYFPVFDSYSRSYLYWDKPDIENGIYTKDKMYYAVDPFVLDSLEDFDGTKLVFDGEFFSSEILPSFRQSLQVMEDFTLGFKKQAPPEGYRMYNGKGRFFNEVIVDNRGLRGNGQMEYLGTIARSDSFTFHFDSVMATVKYFNLKRGYRGGVYFPQVDAQGAKYKWYTKLDALALSSEYEDLSIFDGQGRFKGTLFITSKGMVGKGEITLGQVKIRGDSIRFNEMDFSTQNSDFILLDEADSTRRHFVAENVNIKYDVIRHSTSFEASAPGAGLANFPIHQYQTNLTKGAFDRASKQLKLVGLPGQQPYFVSSDPKQQQLQFPAKEAFYRLDNQEIRVNGVPSIEVADALITPDSAKLVIQNTGLIRTLERATVEADRSSKMHKIYDAKINIFSRAEYEGAGKYNYIEINAKKQFIQFDNIEVNSSNTTVASGEIRESDAFYLTERILFRGQAELDASRKFLSFEGEVKIESENPVFKGAWFTFDKTIVNPDSVFIPIADDLTNDAGEFLTVGLNYVPENRVFYSNFLQAKEDEDDVEVLRASGGLTFDRRKKEFKIGSESKLKNQVFKGATVSFNDAENTITSQGFLSFPYNFPEKTLTMKMAGSWKEDLRRRQLSTSLILAADMSVVPAEQLNKVAQNLAYLTAASKNIDFKQRTFLESIAELLDEGQKGERETGKFIQNEANAMVYTDVKLAQQLPYTVLLSGVNFNYSREYKALYSDSEVGLIGLGGNPINKIVNAKIVYDLGGEDEAGDKIPDEVIIYLEVDEFNWIYFRFADGVVRTISSYYDEFNYPLQAILDKQKSSEGYRFELASEDERARFLQDFVKKYIRE